MLTYTNNGLTLVTILLLFILLRRSRSIQDLKKEKVLLGVLFMSIVVNLYGAYKTQKDIKMNIIAFTQGQSLICTLDVNSPTLSLQSGTNIFTLSKSNGWSRDKDYFVISPFMVRADVCKR